MISEIRILGRLGFVQKAKLLYIQVLKRKHAQVNQLSNDDVNDFFLLDFLIIFCIIL